MKRKNAFTLIELLAIIVILAIIAVITVPIILNIIENAKKGAAQDSAYGYKDAINKWYIQELTEDSTKRLDGKYTISNGKLNNIDIPLSGDKPASGTLTYSNNMLTGGCLTIGDYKITFDSEGNPSNTEKGECETTQYLYITQKDIYIYPDMYLGIFDGNQWQEKYIKSEIKLQLSNGTTKKPTTNNNSYLKYELADGELIDGAIPEACVYSETFDGELCLNNNNYEISTQQVKNYFRFNEETWVNISNNNWMTTSAPSTSCVINESHIYCTDEHVGIYAYSNGNINVFNRTTNISCTVYSDGSSKCK